MKTETRTEQIGVRYTPEERALIESAARREQRTLADWLRLLSLRAAKRLLGRRVA